MLKEKSMRWCRAHYPGLFLLIFLTLVTGHPTDAAAHSVKQLEEIAAEAKSLDDFLKNPRLQARYEAALRSYQSRDRFRCESFEKIIAKVKVLQKGIPTLGERLWTRVETPVITVEATASEKDPLATSAANSSFTIQRLPRNFHGLFFDPSPAGCLSDNCSEADYFSPDRWAAALKDSEVYVVEKNGIFTDLTLLVTPVTQGKQTYGLVSLGGGPGLARLQTLRLPPEKKWKRSSLLNAWLSIAAKMKPKDWRGYVRMRRPQSKQPAIRLLASTDSSAERKIGKPDQFSSAEDLGKQIRGALPNRCLASVRDDKKYLLGLSSEPAASMVLIASGSLTTINLTSGPAVAEFLSNAVTPTQLPGLAEVTPAQVNEFKSTVTNLMLNAKAPETRANAGLALNVLNAETPKAAPSNEVISSFLKALKDPSPIVREVAGLGLLDAGAPGRTGIPPVSDAFTPRADRSFPAHFPEFLDRAARALGDKRDPQGLAEMDRFLRKPDKFPDELRDSAPFRRALAGATDALVRNGIPVDKKAVGNLLDNFSRAEDPQERAKYRDTLVDLMRNNKDPQATVDALERADRNPRTRELAQEVREEANREKLECDEDTTKEGR